MRNRYIFDVPPTDRPYTDRIIDRVSPMEHGMPRISFIHGVTAANFFHHLAYVTSLEDLVRREVNDAENRASAGRLYPQLTALRRSVLVTSGLTPDNCR